MFMETLFWKQAAAVFFLIRLCRTKSKQSEGWEFLSKWWCCWQAVPLDERYPSNQNGANGGRVVVYCVLDASPCCRLIVHLGRMINVTLKGSEWKSWRTCPPSVTANKASLNMGLLKIHTKAEEDCHLFSLLTRTQMPPYLSLVHSWANIYT